MRNEDDGTDGPGGEVIVEDVKIGSVVLKYSLLHFGVGGIHDF